MSSTSLSKQWMTPVTLRPTTAIGPFIATRKCSKLVLSTTRVYKVLLLACVAHSFPNTSHAKRTQHQLQTAWSAQMDPAIQSPAQIPHNHPSHSGFADPSSKALAAAAKS